MASSVASSTLTLIGEKTEQKIQRTSEQNLKNKFSDGVLKYLKIEAYRLVTFRNYSSGNIISPIMLAAEGFIYIGEGGNDDTVICVFCNLTKSNWTPSNVVSEVHREMSPNCTMVKRSISSFRLAFTSKNNESNLAIEQDSQKAGTTSENAVETDAAPDIAQARTTDHRRASGSSLQFASLSVAKPSVLNNRASTRNPINWSAEVRPDTRNLAQATVENSQSMIQPNISNNYQNQARTPEISTSARENATESFLQAPEPLPQLYGSSSGNVAPRNNETQATSTPSAQSATTSQTSLATDVARELPSQAGAAAAKDPVLYSSGSSDTGKKKDPTYADLCIITERPKRTEYALKIRRLETFVTWPRDHHLRPEELADAGFYYAGYGDCSRCFFCGGGLRNWEDEDDVWVEHARWFPKCAFIRQQVGQVFVDTVQNLTKEIEQISFNKVIEKMGVDESTLCIGTKNTPLKNDPAVLAVVQLGYLEKDVLYVALRVKEESNLISADLLLNKLWEENCRRITKSERIIQQKDLAESVDIMKLFRQLKESNNQLRQQIVCKICLDKDVAVVFLPCGHLVSCTDCALAMKDCPVCRKHVRGTVRAFIA